MGNFAGKSAATDVSRATNAGAATDTSLSVRGASPGGAALPSGNDGTPSGAAVACFGAHVAWLARAVVMKEDGTFSDDDERVRHHRAIIRYYHGPNAEPKPNDFYWAQSVCDLVAHLLMCTAVGADNYEKLKSTLPVDRSAHPEFVMPIKGETTGDNRWCSTGGGDDKGATMWLNNLVDWAGRSGGPGFAQIKFDSGNDYHTFVLERQYDGKLMIHQGYQMIYRLISMETKIEIVTGALKAGLEGSGSLKHEYLWLPEWAVSAADKKRISKPFQINRVGALVFDRVDSSAWQQNRNALRSHVLVEPQAGNVPPRGKVTPYFACSP